MNVKITNANQPSWKNVTVKSHIPAAFQPLDEIAHNLWFCWNQEALDLFRSLDAKIWEDVDQNPVELLNRISYKRLTELSEDKEVLARIKKCTNSSATTWTKSPTQSALLWLISAWSMV